jgi:Fanconi anemia group M protein
MKEIENIFSNSTIIKKPICPNSKIPIIIDTREKQSLIAANLLEQKANISFEKLEIGDYIIGETCIERKTFSDFVSSMINKRLSEQLINIKKYSKYFLILEGFYYNYDKFKIHENAIRGMLLSIANDFKIPIIYTENELDTSKFLITLARHSEKSKIKAISIRQSKNLKTLEEQKQFILEGFPGIGPVAAKTLLIEFSNLKNIFNALPEELQKIKLDESQIKKFFRILND